VEKLNTTVLKTDDLYDGEVFILEKQAHGKETDGDNK
jgi:hypothetical protein